MPAMDAPLPPCVTIDATPLEDTPDNFYLSNASHGTPDAGANAGTASAVANLEFCGGRDASIVGHGCPGLIETYNVEDEYIAQTNWRDWQHDLARLNGELDSLTLYGCCVAKDDDGLEFMQTLADTVNAPVSAPDDFIYCDENGDFTLEVGGAWVTVHPTEDDRAERVARAIEPPPPPPLVPQPVNRNILSAAYFQATGVQAEGSASLQIAQEVIWKPFTPPGEPGARPTGKLQVSWKGTPGQGPITKTYLILADLMLREDDLPANRKGPAPLYRTTPLFQKLIAAQRSK